ncbi:UNVERIFIED_ORG: transposase-like protein [Rhizobium etli]
MAEPAARALLSTRVLRCNPGQIRDEGFVRNKAVYIALAVLADGTKEILGLWIEQTEGAKFWLRVMNELKNRGCQDILIAVIDGLKGFPEAITAAFPQTIVQTCIVHLIRHSLEFMPWKDRKPVVPGAAGNLPRQGRRGRNEGARGVRNRILGSKISCHRSELAAQLGTRHSLLRFPEGVRRIIYTTNAIEALNSKLRRAVRSRGLSPVTMPP